ncbi:recombinase family protein [Nocardioides sp. L-11A]|uniref:recombinase family protein n=1 Tax=Nocardioides sp. L-11A TaxID=3043848 RepID=UPI00249BEA0C|nr:recombinase family protein [Nocardioides sp. L-11A]
MRAAIYVRISRDYAGEQLGVQRQQEDCEALAGQLGWQIVDVYIDNDVSATGKKPRPAYQRLLADLRAGTVDAIVAWHADRLYRRAMDLGELVEVCKATNAQVATVNAGSVDLTTPTGRLVAGLLAQVATYEVEHKTERWARSWQQGRELGAPVTNSNRLFGYERDGATVVPTEASVAREMIDRLLAGESQGSVLRWLDDAGIRTTRGKVWRASGLKVYLLNPRIAGWSTHKGEIVAEGNWPAIVDRDRWEQARAFLSSRTRAYVPRKNLLPGLLFCGKCKMRMISGGSTRQAAYRCPSRPNMPGCGGVSVSVRYVEDMVESFAQERLENPVVRRRLTRLRSQPNRGRNKELADLDTRILELEQQLEEPGTPVPTLVRAINRAKARQEELLEDMNTLPRVPLPVQGGPWPEDLGRRRELVELVVSRIEIKPLTKPTRNVFDPDRVVITER